MSNWDELLALVEFAFNNARSESTGYTPFFLNYGKHPRVPAAVITLQGGNRYNGAVPSVENFVGHMDSLMQRAKGLIYAAQQRQKFYADKSRKEQEFRVGDKVLLSTKNLRLKDASAKKLLPKYMGPLTIKERIGKVAYKLEMPSNLKVHPVFHVNLLHAWKEGGSYQPPPWQHLAPTTDGLAEIERCLAHRDSRRGTQVYKDYLVQWANGSKEDARWVPYARVPHDLITEYWQSRVPTQHRGSVLESPLAASLRRSRRQLGLDPRADSTNGDNPPIGQEGPAWEQDPFAVIKVLNLMPAYLP